MPVGTLIAGSLTNFVTGDSDDEMIGKGYSSQWFNSHAGTSGRWDAVIAHDDGVAAGDFFVCKDVKGIPVYTLELDDRTSSRPDIYWDDAARILYVASFHNVSCEYWELTYDDGTDTYSLSVGAERLGETITGIVRQQTGKIGALYLYSNGDVWVSILNNAGLHLNRRTGGSWNGAILTLDAALDDGVVALTEFENGGTTNIYVISSEDESHASAEINAYFIDQDHVAPFVAGNWTEDPITIQGLLSTDANDHIDIVFDKVTEIIYVVLKTGNALVGEPLIAVLKRTPAGVYTAHTVSTKTGSTATDRTRPAIALDGENDELYVASSKQDTGDLPVFIVKADLADLDTWSAEELLFDLVGSEFNNVRAPQPNFNATGVTDLLFIAPRGTPPTTNDDDLFHSLIDIAGEPPAPDAVNLPEYGQIRTAIGDPPVYGATILRS